MNQIEAVTPAGAPFDIHSQDAAHGLYHLAGTLWRKNETEVRLDPFEIQMKLTNGNGVSSSGPMEFELGKPWGMQGVGGILLSGYSVKVSELRAQNMSRQTVSLDSPRN